MRVHNIEADLALRDTNVSSLMWNGDGRSTCWSCPTGALSFAGVDVDLFVETCVVSLGGILTGRASIDREIQQGALFLSGNAGLARTMHRWLRGSSYAAIAGIATLHPGSALSDQSP